MNRKLLACLLAATLIGTAGCSTIAAPDQVGLYYLEGNSDGYKFDKCIDPGATGDAEWNNSVVYLPTSLRTWNIAPEGGDTNVPVVASSKPQEGQPSGVEVSVWSQTNMFLNTYCDSHGGMVRQFWETVGRRYKADTDEGWRNMVKQTVVSALEKATRDVVRSYPADDLVGNVGGVLAEVQQKISAQFAAELKRLAGGDFFCGPAFNRIKPDCPPIEVIIKDVTFTDAGIQQARNEKQKALEIAAAQLARAQGEAAALKAEAKGKSDAAAELQKLYANPAWVKLQLAILQAQMAKDCGQNPNCHMIVGADGNIILQP